MKASNFPKWVFTQLLFLLTILFSCKKTEVSSESPKIKSNKTIKEIVFSGQPNLSGTVTQLSLDKKQKRYLIPLQSNNKILHKYYLIEQNLDKNTHAKTFVISKQPLTSGVDLFTIAFTSDGVTAIDLNSKEGTSNKLLLKNNNKELNMNEKFSNIGNTNIVPNYANPGEGEVGYCIDHWWVVYNVDTGVIISIEYTGSDCYGCILTGNCSGNGLGGGYTGGNPDSLNALLFITMTEATQIDDKMLNISTINLSPGGGERSRKYIWRCITNPFGWNIISEEESVEDKQPVTIKQPNHNLWYFRSLVHRTCTKVGVSVGGTVTVKQHSGTLASLGNNNATMNLSVTLEYAVLGIPGIASWDVPYFPQTICSINPYPGGGIVY